MKEPEIFASKNQLEHLKNLSYNDNCEATKHLYKTACNSHKKLLRRNKADFIKKNPTSRKPKATWNMANRILHPQPKKITQDPESLN